MGSSVDELVIKIRNSEVRGSTNIAVLVAEALVRDAEEYIENKDMNGDLKLSAQNWGTQLIRSRPSQITLRNSIKNVLAGVEKIHDNNDLKVFEVLKSNGEAFVEQAKSASEKISVLGGNIIRDGDVILTNSHSALTREIFNMAANQMEKDIEVYVAETRPRYQGMKMVKELVDLGIKTTLVIDAAIRHLMPEIDMVIMGADTVGSDDSVISKIGASQIALVAHESRVPFYVAAPTFKFSEDTLSGVMISIEEGKKSEIIKDTVLDGMEENEFFRIRNPSFDATRADHITGIITELYIMSPHSIGEYLARKSGVIN